MFRVESDLSHIELKGCRGDESTANPTAGTITSPLPSKAWGTDHSATQTTAGPTPTPSPTDQETTKPSQSGRADNSNAPQVIANTPAASLSPSSPEPSQTQNITMTEEKILPQNASSIVLKPNQDEVNNATGSSQVHSGSSPTVFVSVLMAGLLLAATIVGIYYFKCHRRTNGKGIKLAEESYMADEENQGNTLVSVAPLNQPEPQEKPSLNGESQEAVKAQTPPAATNGHSTTKTADTEL
ncbi:mucin-1-like isoform X1 [Labeo rohita]|uniref:Mucin-1-like isoform X1 n=1 Tax=Labeo rohita TaxID=84645 RepID=A0A498P351_LABRO|nr:mucin-1-like isoform X1 [Labeo rohita]